MQHDPSAIKIVPGSVLDQDVDAIVNAANTALRGGGGVDGAIHRAAGPELMEELRRVAPHGTKAGTAVMTGGHRLKQRHIIHTPGPVWHGGRSGEPEQLASCYRSCLELADKAQLTSIAFCSLSTGVYGYPIAQAAPLALQTILSWLEGHPGTTLRHVIFALYGEREYEVFQQAMEQIGR